MLDSYSNHRHEALDGLCMALLQIIIKKNPVWHPSLPLLTTFPPLSTRQSATDEFNRLKQPEQYNRQGCAHSCWKQLHKHCKSHTEREDASHCSSSGPQSIMTTRTPKSRASLLASTLQFLMNIPVSEELQLTRCTES